MYLDFMGDPIEGREIFIILGSLQRVPAYIEDGIAKPYPFTQIGPVSKERKTQEELELFEVQIRPGKNSRIDAKMSWFEKNIRISNKSILKNH